MKSLYESILDSTKSGLKSAVWDKTKPVIDNVLNSHSDAMRQFIDGNNLKLNKDDVKKIVNKLKNVLPKGAVFGACYGIPQIAKQDVEKYNTINYSTTRYACYKIEIEYGTRPWGPYSHVSETTIDEFLIYLTEDYIYALDIPETKSMLDSLDKHFTKYTAQDKVKLTNTYKMKSNIGGEYRIYSFKDITKEFIIGK